MLSVEAAESIKSIKAEIHRKYFPVIPISFHCSFQQITRLLPEVGETESSTKLVPEKAEVLYDTPYEDINGIYGDDEGDIWFSASKEVKKGKSRMDNNLFIFSEKKIIPEDKSALYLKHTGGEVEELWSSPVEQIYSLAPDKKNGGVLIGTGRQRADLQSKKGRQLCHDL